MMRKYPDEILKELHSVELDMLTVFVDICERHHIDYFVSFGTAIGTIRHGGFIPWDDDIDIGMMRSEYEKLREVSKAEWGKDFFIADARDDCIFHRSLFPRMYKRGTAFETELYAKYLKPKKVDKFPIYIDIFLFDHINEKTNLKFRSWLSDSFKSALLCATCERRIYKSDSISVKTVSLIKKCLICMLKLFTHPERDIYKMYLNYLRHHSKGEYVTCFEVVDPRQAVALFSKEGDMFPTLEMTFEGIPVRIQRNYDDVLTKQYGNYKILPPKEKRHNALPRVLDFGDGRGNVLESLWVNQDV